MDEFVQVEVRAELQNIEIARKDASDLAWEHAKVAATSSGISLGDPRFEDLYKLLDKTYNNLTDHLEFLMYNALVVLRALLNTGEIAFTAETPIKDTELAGILGYLAQKIVSSYAWMIAGYNVAWPSNDEMPRVGVSFNFPATDIIITQE